MSNYPLFETSAVHPPFHGKKDLSHELAPWRRLRKQVKTGTSTEWRLSTFTGRLGEISGDLASASLTLVFRLVLEAQKLGEPVAWITSRKSTFYPPDVADVGVDLSALAVILAPDTLAAARAADHISRSGAYSLVVMDVGANAHLPLHVQARLAGLARKHGTAILCITENAQNQPSLGSLVALRIHTTRWNGRGHRLEDSGPNSSGRSPLEELKMSKGKMIRGRGNGSAQRFQCEAQFLKDKRRGPGRGHMEVYSGPDGLP
jgi:recombination protein RecA